MPFSKMYLLLFFFTGLTFSAASSAQDSLPKTNNPSYFKFSTSYLSNAVYNGRKDSLAIPYITPSLGYFDKSGFYVSASLSYSAAKGSRGIDLVSLSAGYDFTIGSSMDGGIYASKDFYSRSSTAARSEVTGSLGAYFSYNPGPVTLGGGIDMLVSGKSDITASSSLSHSFSFGNTGDAWSIAPTLSAGFGTQNYYQTLLKNRQKKRNGNQATVQVQENNKFSILSYEISLPISYDAYKWGCYFTPTYAIPKSPVSRTSPGGTVFIVEKLENVLYAELGFYVKF